MTEGVDATPAPLTVATDLTLTVEGVEAPVRSTGDRLFVEFPSVVSAIETFRSLPPAQRERLHDGLAATGLALEVRARHRTLATVGSGTRAGVLSHRLGVAPADVRLCGVLSALAAGVSETIERLR